MPSALVQILAIVLFIGGLILVHELGHFLVAKALGVKVLRFSIGFGPRAFGFKRGETEYWLAVLPLGGYVRMAGDGSEDPAKIPPEDRGRGYLDQAPWKRLAISVAGPAMNLVFPLLVFLALAVAENGSLVPGPYVGTVLPGTAAAAAGLRSGDRILSIASPRAAPRPVRWWADLREVVADHPEIPLVVRVQRDGVELPPITVTPAAEVDRNPLETSRRGVLGVSAGYTPALVAPAHPGAAGPLAPFDLVVAAGGRPVKHLGDLEKALAATPCQPVDLEVLRDSAVPLPGATLSTPRAEKLAAVPTCDAGGKPTFLPADPLLSTFVAAVEPGSPAAQVGLRRGDAIAAVNGKAVRSYRDINARSAEFLPRPAEGGRDPEPPSVRLDLADGRTVTLLPTIERYKDELTREDRRRYVLGFQPDRHHRGTDALLVEQVPLARSPREMVADAWEKLAYVVRITFTGIVKLVTGQLSFKAVGGPIMLFSMAAEAAEEGLSSFLVQMAAISVNLALMNLVPIPVLDGGNIVQALLEAITRRPISARARMVAQGVGVALLVTLMLLVFKNDILRLMG
ncbi:MAG TPA: site-2 protease family protein [Anaeromyxobacter sp.]